VAIKTNASPVNAPSISEGENTPAAHGAPSVIDTAMNLEARQNDRPRARIHIALRARVVVSYPTPMIWGKPQRDYAKDRTRHQPAADTVAACLRPE